MQGLEAALKRKDADASIFLAPKSLRVGGFWLPELAKEIAEATVFVLLVGASGLGPWQVIEYYEALDRRVKQQGFPVVLVLLDGQAAPGLPFLRQLHWITTPDPSSEKTVAQLMDAAGGGGTTPGELWRHTAPYRGLVAMTEADTDFFFGRGRETAEVIGSLAAASEKLPVLLGNSGVGKSSVAQAGVLAAFMRQAWPEAAGNVGVWPQAFEDSRRWCVLKLKPGTEPVRALSSHLSEHGSSIPLTRAVRRAKPSGLKISSKDAARCAGCSMPPRIVCRSRANPSRPHSCCTSTRLKNFTYVRRSTNAAVSRKSLPKVSVIRDCER